MLKRQVYSPRLTAWWDGGNRANREEGTSECEDWGLGTPWGLLNEWGKDLGGIARRSPVGPGSKKGRGLP